MDPADTIDAVEQGKIRFHYFDDAVIRRFMKEARNLHIREESPTLIEVSDGIVPCLGRAHTQRNRRLTGVYDAAGKPVELSCRVRGSGMPFKSGKRSAPFRPTALDDARPDARAAYYLGAEAKSYGHFLLETLCRAWAWDEGGKDRIPIIQSSPVKGFARDLLSLVPGLGERLECLQHTTRFSDVLVPEAAFAIRQYAYRAFKQTCERISHRALAGRAKRTDQPLYISRSKLEAPFKRKFVGEERLECFLESQGFLIVSPETLPISEQIRLFNSHRWIVGQLGSALHSRIFSTDETNLLVLGNKLHPNYMVCDMLSDGTAHYGNVLGGYNYLAETGIERHLSSEPLVMNDELCLEFLRKFDLIGPGAVLNASAPEQDEYRRLWMENARLHARRYDDVEMLKGLQMIATSSKP